MTEFDRLLRWYCADRLDERLRQACGHWILLTALGLDPTQCGLPSGVGLSTALGFGAMPAVFALPEETFAVVVFGLWQPPMLDVTSTATEPLDPLNRDHWRFWVVSSRHLHPDRRSIALNPLMRAHGEGQAFSGLADQLVAFRVLNPTDT
jgi:hypothetical protein